MATPDVDIERALTALGELLSYEGEQYGIVVAGGAALILLGVVTRATKDVDVLGLARLQDGEVQSIGPPEPFPPSLDRAVRRVARDFGLPVDWLNTVVGLQWRTGLPPGCETRIAWRDYSGLKVGLLHRRDLIFFKLYAAVDAVGPQSKHFQDLLALEPDPQELQDASQWVKQQDASPQFTAIVDRVVGRVQASLE